jgi:hypothetical protein
MPSLRSPILLVLAAVLVAAACGDGNHVAAGVRASATPFATPTPVATATPGIDLATLAGVYDLQATSTQREFSGASIGVVDLDDAGNLRVELDFDVDNHIRVSATFVGPNELVLAGDGRFQGDIAFATEGTGLVEIDGGGVRRIWGSVDGQGFGSAPATVAFVLERHERPNLTPYNGQYRFDFGSSPSGCAGASHALLELHFGDDGHGASRTRATDRGAADTVFGTFDPGSCRLSPSGRIHCSLRYLHACAPDEPWGVPIEEHYLRLTGQLFTGSGSVVGAGRVERGLFGPRFGGQSWTARRRP